ncbi:MAG: GIY-YIG nuclease family protein [Anaerolineae bacterium]
MFHVYILRSARTQRYYVGSTQDIANRVREHNAGEQLSTRAGIPWELVYHAAFETRAQSVRCERKIKARGIGRYLSGIGVRSGG